MAQALTSSQSTSIPQTPTADPAPESWLQVHVLAIAAILTWVSLALAWSLQQWTNAPQAAVVGIYLVAYLAGGTLAARTALDDLRHGTVNIDLLMVVAALGAAALGAWAEGAMLLALFSSSNALEHYALGRTRSAVRKLMELSPTTARLLVDGVEREVGTAQLVPGDLIVVRPGEKIPADGTLVDGRTEVNQAAITGESMPVTKEAGESIFAGTLNGSGAFTARVTQPASETTLARIARMVENAQSQKSKAERFTDAFEGPYAIGVIVAALLVGIVPWVLGDDPGSAFYRAITLLVVASPCALVISTPAATLSAIASAARGGVLVKGGSHLDSVGKIDVFAFDKTGTLTLGRPMLTDMVVFDDTTEDDALRLIASVEHFSEHPIARAVVDGAVTRELIFDVPEEFGSDPGRGVSAIAGGRVVHVGNETLFTEAGIVVPPHVVETANAIRAQGRTAVIAGDNHGFFAVAGVADQIRPGAVEALADLRKLGVKRIVMLTGDNALVGAAIGQQLGLDEVYTDLQPEDKLRKIAELQQHGTVAMIGDGVNDAPALAAADLGIAMGAGGTDVALETADMVLITGDLSRLAYAVRLGRRMRRTIKLSIGFALAVIAVLALTTLSVGIPLPLGVVGHEGSTVIVVLVGLTLLAYRPHLGKSSDVRPATA